MRIEIFSGDDEIDGPIDVFPETWNDEKMHVGGLSSDQGQCWCEPRIDGRYIHHRSVLDAVESDLYRSL